MPSTNPCPACTNPVSTDATTCPKCGHKLREEQTAGGILGAIIIGLILGVALIAFVKAT